MLEIEHTKSSELSMNFPSTHAIGSEPDVLEKVREEEVNLALWQRLSNVKIQRELASLNPGHLPDLRRRTSLFSFDEDVERLLLEQGLHPQKFEHLRADLKDLVKLLGAVSGSDEFIFRLVTISGNECCRFHLDRTPLRMICTYQGPGTEWLADWQVDRDALERSARNEAIMLSGKPSQFEQFWVGIMKGDPGNKGRGLVHRSPAVVDSKEMRVLFCLDAENQFGSSAHAE